ADLLTLHFKAVDGNGNAVTSTPVHYTTAVTDAGIVKDTPACTTNGSGECTSTVKTTKAGTYNVWVALVPAGAAQPVSPVKTALVFLAGPPDATNTTVSTDKSAANADNKETITLTLTPRDSHNNVVPLWTFSKDLTIVPSVNATVPGAVTVTTPTQDAAGNVAATLKYVDTSGKLLSKEARAGTTTIAIGKAVKQTVDTRFYPRVHVCTTNLSASGYIVPGQTEVRICDGSNHAVPDGSGYTVTLAGMSATGCTKGGGGVCPPDTVGKKADFTGLTGDDIAELVYHPTPYYFTDDISHASFASPGPAGRLAYVVLLSAEYGPSTAVPNFTADDVFRTREASAYCDRAPGNPYGGTPPDLAQFADALTAGTATGGATAAGGSGGGARLYIGNVTDAVRTGTDARPTLFTNPLVHSTDVAVAGAQRQTETSVDALGVPYFGTFIPSILLMVDGAHGIARSYIPTRDGLDFVQPAAAAAGEYTGVAFGRRLAAVTGMSLKDMYTVGTDPGMTIGAVKPDKSDFSHLYVVQANYVSGYVCEASLQ
ncbi:Ig-like domain-containing protein, partial [Salmonella enterica]|nr:Ig-like domain-containing protein [Salmonella enterica]